MVTNRPEGKLPTTASPRPAWTPTAHASGAEIPVDHFSNVRIEVELTLCGDRYVFPRGDVLVLPIDNISVEALAAHCAELLKAKLAAVLPKHARRLEVTVEESPGQGSTAIIDLG